jgi:hypothetical protein
MAAVVVTGTERGDFPHPNGTTPPVPFGVFFCRLEPLRFLPASYPA